MARDPSHPLSTSLRKKQGQICQIPPTSGPSNIEVLKSCQLQRHNLEVLRMPKSNSRVKTKSACMAGMQVHSTVLKGGKVILHGSDASALHCPQVWRLIDDKTLQGHLIDENIESCQEERKSNGSPPKRCSVLSISLHTTHQKGWHVPSPQGFLLSFKNLHMQSQQDRGVHRKQVMHVSPQSPPSTAPPPHKIHGCPKFSLTMRSYSCEHVHVRTFVLA